MELLSVVAVENVQQAEKEKATIVQLQCLKCQAEFSQPPSLSEQDVYQRYQDKMEKEHTVGKKKSGNKVFTQPGYFESQTSCVI